MNTPLMVTAIQTSIFHQGDDLISFILRHIDPASWQENTILAVTSKIVSLAENRLVSPEGTDKKELIRQEADHYLGEIGHGVSLTIKEGLLLPAAGIDESNSERGDYILHPQDPFASADLLCQELKKCLGLKHLGVILTDSRSGPLRMGVVGVALSFAGFQPLKNMVGTQDLFGRPLKMTKINHVDSLAAAAVLMMGEASESTPLAVLQNAPVQFTEQVKASDLLISPEEDMYLPLYRHLLK